MNSNLLGFHTAPNALYFKNEPDYSIIKEQFRILDYLAEMANISICVLDFYKHEYAYMSKNHIYLCGYSMEEASKMGEELPARIIYEEDLVHQGKMKDAACELIMDLDKDRLQNFQLFTTHRLKHKNGAVFKVSNRYKPILFDDNGQMWLALDITTMANKNHKIESYVEIEGYNERYLFSEKKNTFILSKSVKLSVKEQELLTLSFQGFCAKEIAEKMHISLHTVKFHKEKIKDKLNVQNMTEACLYAFSHNLF